MLLHQECIHLQLHALCFYYLTLRIFLLNLVVAYFWATLLSTSSDKLTVDCFLFNCSYSYGGSRTLTA